MKKKYTTSVITTALAISLCGLSADVLADRSDKWDDDDCHGYKKGHHDKQAAESVQLGPRPFFLVNDMDEGKLKRKLQSCADKPSKKSDFSIGHRGAAMQFPEHTMESYVAAARMGAGILECDVTFTKDRELVCRHSQCDLHTTTNILATDLGSKCSEPFTPAEFDPITGERTEAASALCCTSDITLVEFKTLCGKMDAFDPDATTIEDYLGGTANWRTDLYATCGTVLSHAESIELFKKLGAKMTPELKSPSVEMPFDGFSQEDYAQKMIDEYKAADVDADHVWAQSFNLEDVFYWIENEPEFGEQAVYLDGRYDDTAFDHTDPATWNPTMEELEAAGVNIIAPPMWMLLALDDDNEIVPSVYAETAEDAGLDIITWTLERSGPLASGGGWYYQTITDTIDNDGDILVVLDVLAQDVGVLGVFTDWPATVTYYANCMGLK
jgi:glycerophosphoryl diester phosphodiesterase